MNNIAILIETLTGGGAERVAGLLSVFLAKKYRVYLLVSDADHITYDYDGMIIKVGENGILNDIASAKKKNEIDCAISFSENMNYANILTRAGEKVIISHRNTTDIKSQKIPMIRRYYPYADAIVACSEGCRELLIKNAALDERKVVTIYNFLNGFKRFPYESGNAWEMPFSNKDYILSVGRLTWEKNQKYLIQEFAYYKKHNDSDLKLIIIGSGKLKDDLEHEIEKLEAQEYIVIIPYTNDLKRYYENAKAFVLSSITEGFPNVLLDALYFGLPVISTDCISGPREILNDEVKYTESTDGIRVGKRGILVQPIDDGAEQAGHFLAEAIKMLFADTMLYKNTRQNAKHYIEQYSNDRIYYCWEKLIEETKASGMKFCEEEYDEALKRMNVVIIYGAGKYGQAAAKNVKNLGKKLFFAVTDTPERTTIDGIAVRKMTELVEYKDDAIVLLASYYERYRSQMMDLADELGFKNIFLARL